MIITRTAKFIDGKMVYDPPLTKAEKAADANRFAEMVSTRKAPGLNGTDRAFLEGDVIHHGLQNQAPFMREHMVEQARKAGINITGKVYKSGLADQRGPADPMAWVGGTDDVLAACKAKNLNCRGSVNHKGHELPPKPDVLLAESLIKEQAAEYVAQNPEWKRKPEELRQMIIEKHGTPSKFKNPKPIKIKPDVPDPD